MTEELSRIIVWVILMFNWGCMRLFLSDLFSFLLKEFFDSHDKEVEIFFWLRTFIDLTFFVIITRTIILCINYL